MKKYKLSKAVAAFAVIVSHAYADVLHDQEITGRLLNSSDTYTGTTTITAAGLGESGLIRVDDGTTTSKFEGSINANIDGTSVSYSNAFVATGAGSVIDIKTVSDTDSINVNVNGFIGAGFSAKNSGLVKVDGSSGKGTYITLEYASGAATSTQEAGAIEAQGGTSRFEGAGDFIINVAQERGYGIWTNSGSASVYIDGNVDITTTGKGGYGIRADHGEVHITGNLDIDTQGSGATGLLYHAYGIQIVTGANVIVEGNATIKTVSSAAHGLYSAASRPWPSTSDAGINIRGDLEITLSGSSAYGIYNNGGTFKMDASTTVKTVANAVYASSSDSTRVANINFNGKTSLQVSGNTAHGLYANGLYATINVNTSDLSITSTGTGAGHAVYAASRGTVNLNGITQKLSWRDSGNLFYAQSGGRIIGSEAKYLLEGKMTAGTATSGQNAQIDISMSDASYYKGQTVTNTGGQIDLKFKKNSTWENLVATSSLSSVEFESSQLIMTLASAVSYSKLQLALFTGDLNSVIKVILAADFIPQLGDEFQLVDATGEIIYSGKWDFSQAVLEEGLGWDTSTFTQDGTIRVVAIPEPATLSVLFGLAGLTLAISRRRKN